MRRCCGDITLADDLAQQVFMQAWRTIHHLHRRDRFDAWLKRVAINTWLQHVRKNDPLKNAEEHDETNLTQQDTTGIAMDLDTALATLPNPVRLCVVLSYHEGMTHSEIADTTGLAPGTIKSHIRRGSERLRRLLSAYEDTPPAEDSE
jgi:RNA polymerase sigma-70 factor (ECF subfamily)